jgi:hypothetical protein
LVALTRDVTETLFELLHRRAVDKTFFVAGVEVQNPILLIFILNSTRTDKKNKEEKPHQKFPGAT